ncbi:nuclear transport factor 2 family protein [Actinoplanes sp. LDG1-06]|uniref:Nuclear transport factor 2 family protein n=1 Tax=Paractinoplanes ovalisporus TaxID=2810368 RepID=A0ABS2AIZ2_9ACTN|nr:nuclear transport factor 2 family protein [Actinoplanes ovalisporus]MBM2619780.1 nuclear transport factor 2 family protein [Actinoplanes ovalisporus]
MQELVDRAELIELLSRYANIADLKEFTSLPARVFTDPLTLDFESVAAIPPMTVPLDAYIEILRSSFDPFLATHHAITGHVITIKGDTAEIHAHVRAEHWLPADVAGDGPDRWLVAGFYDNVAVRTADGWRLTEVKLTATHQENPHLAAVATAGS